VRGWCGHLRGGGRGTVGQGGLHTRRQSNSEFHAPQVITPPRHKKWEEEAGEGSDGILLRALAL